MSSSVEHTLEQYSRRPTSRRSWSPQVGGLWALKQNLRLTIISHVSLQWHGCIIIPLLTLCLDWTVSLSACATATIINSRRLEHRSHGIMFRSLRLDTSSISNIIYPACKLVDNLRSRLVRSSWLCPLIPTESETSMLSISLVQADSYFLRRRTNC